jgi:hypothetical protein
MEADERAEREKRLAKRVEASDKLANEIARDWAHAKGQPWNPSDPWKHYPTRDELIQAEFARMDHEAAKELAAARRAAARVLAEHGVHAQIVIDSNAYESPHPAGPEPSGEGAQPPASRSMAASGPGVRHRYGLPRGANEPGYVKLRLARFRTRLDEARKQR